MEELFNSIYKGKRVLVTGHTGFKGAWLSIWLNKVGAKIIGVSLGKNDNDYVYKKTGLTKFLAADYKIDINDYKKLKKIFEKHKPEIVFHLAAQPLVRLSYDEPLQTVNTNIIGTANILECIKNIKLVKAAVIITTDKCYKNKEQVKPYKEEDELGGYDPYSCSKACVELVVFSYRKSFFQNSGKLVASVRAGNILGGGDFGRDRLVPDCIKALIDKKDIEIRNPDSIRPWQFVLEPLYGYLLVGQKLLEEENEFAEAWNFGPDKSSTVLVRKVVDLVIKQWGSGEWKNVSNPDEKKHEAKFLTLDISRAKKKLKWVPKYSIEETVKCAVEWYRKAKENNETGAYNLCIKQIKEYMRK